MYAAPFPIMCSSKCSSLPQYCPPQAPTDASQRSMAMKAAYKHVEQLRQVLLEKVRLCCCRL